MPTLPAPAPQGQPRDYFDCGCQATFGDPADFCPGCLADYDAWLDSLAEERRAEDLQTAGLDYSPSAANAGGEGR